jgi:hypothetical protein
MAHDRRDGEARKFESVAQTIGAFIATIAPAPRLIPTITVIESANLT